MSMQDNDQGPRAFTPPPEEYLSDGLYASFDGFQVKLRAPREHGNDVVYLDGETMRVFWEYVLRVGAFQVKAELPTN